MLLNKTNIILFVIVLYSQLLFAQDEVNSIIGNASWQAEYGNSRFYAASENERILVHLKYVHEILSTANYTGLYPLARQEGLNLLAKYIKQKQFPQHNEIQNQRLPRFIDHKGRLCAVGYLVEQTAGRAEAERINSLFEYARIFEIEDEGLTEWQKTSGFSLRELATIQPEYFIPSPPRFQSYYDPQKNKYGLIDIRLDKRITKPIYKQIIRSADNRLFTVKKTGYWGVLNTKGDKLLPLDYDTIMIRQYWNQNLLFAELRNQSEIYDTNGYMLAELKNGQLMQATVGFLVLTNNGDFGVLAKDGEWRIKPKYKNIYAETLLHFKPKPITVWNDENRALFIVTNHAKEVGVFDFEGKQIIPFDFEKIERKQFVFVATKNGVNTFFSLEGEELNLNGVLEVKPLGNGWGETKMIGRTESGWGLIARDGTWGIKPRFKYIYHSIDFYFGHTDSTVSLFDNWCKPFLPLNQKRIHRYGDVFYYTDFKEWGVKSATGKDVLSPTTSTVEFILYNNGVPMFSIKNGKYISFLFADGRIESIPGVTDAKRIKTGAFYLVKDGKKYISLSGYKKRSVYWQQPFDSIRLLKQGIYAIGNNGKYGYYSFYADYYKEKFETKYPQELDEISAMRFQYESLYLCRKGNNWGLIDLFGTTIVPLEYDDFRWVYDRRLFVTGVYLLKAGEWSYFSLEEYQLQTVNDELSALLKRSKPNQKIDSHNLRLVTIKTKP